jgi:predicted kinase
MKIFKSLKEEYLQEGVYDPGIFKAYFLAGGPGSGKSFVTAGAFAGLGLKLVNSDDILTKYLNAEGLSLKMPEKEKEKRDELRQKAKITTAARTDLYLQGRLGMIMDGTARDYTKISTQQRLFRFLGYQTIMMFINTSLDVALERNANRARSVPENIVKTNWNTVQSNMGKFQKLFQPANFYVIDNSSSEKELVTTTLNRAASIVRRTMNSPHNFIAKQWIERQLRVKKRT